MNKIDWQYINKMRDTIILISDEGKTTHEIEGVDKEVLLNSDIFITYNIKPDYYNKETVKDFITKYHIKQRIVDEYNNLILIADWETLDA
ncbi:hypothetical protein P9E34_14215 [Schinkia azotoformans]|uniref:hypothetical protein n=1 Tax=Schinkia azotoformans TaxID=1454 RepID=UPI002DB5C74C|nr:hypothetical protein [Schinkia azotoformans]MEC1725869.1 hypothetical protein [Schinkia azotoformans]